MLVGGGVSEGAGGAVGESVAGGGAVGAAVAGAADGGRVRGSAVAGDVAAGPGRTIGGVAEAVVELAGGETVAEACGWPGVWRPPVSRVTLNPASATATASEGPRSTYRVKEARPPRPRLS
ncbi:MAG: hypothetical protein AUH39_04565 [Chloroflexi bacterium 13_1_40CM_67_9]|nr:MAG: hypothetical protein AUH39_04565 [Chloroflexi bacterium 13_1_40CM_67_9]